MPTQTEIDYLDGEFTVLETEPSTIAELVELYGEDVVVSETVSNLRYRNKYPRVYRKVMEAVVSSGFEREVVKEEEKKDGTIKKVLEGETKFLRRYLASGDEARAKLAELFPAIGEAEPLYVKGERAPGGGKVSQAAMDAANGVFAQGDEAVENTATAIEGRVPGYKVGRDADGNVTAESLARAIGVFQRHLAKNPLAQLGA